METDVRSELYFDIEYKGSCSRDLSHTNLVMVEQKLKDWYEYPYCVE